MASNAGVPSKKTIIAIILIAILVIAAIIGTVAFLKNRGTAEATEISRYNETTEESLNSDNQNTTDNNSNEENADEQTEENTNQENNDATQEQTNNVGNTETNSNQMTTGTVGTTTDNIQETTITREETITIPEQLIAEGENKIWTPNEINASFANTYSNLNVETPNVEIQKIATTQSGSTLVQAGEIITYTLKVTNNSEEKISKMYVTDIIPEGTVYEETIDNAERELAEQLGCIVSIHMDPVVVDDALTTQTKEQITSLIHAYDSRFSIHDFRMVTGPTHTNVIFDLVVPYKYYKPDNEVKKNIQELIHCLNNSFFAVIQIDHPFIS